MPDIIKEEVRRLARREANAAVKNLKRDAVALKRVTSHLRKAVARLEKAAARHQTLMASLGKQSVRAEGKEALGGMRFRKDTVATLRKRLRLTQSQLAKLAGVSLMTIGKWEKGAVPREKHREAIAGLRKMNARQVRQILLD